MRPLVFVHGFMGGSEQWKAQTPLAESRTLIQVDLPGFGKNAHLEPINRIEGFADWVLRELDSMQVDRFDLLGHSMGGMVVQDMARRAQDRISHLILYATGAEGVLPGRFETIETSMERARSDGAEATARRIAATWFLQQEDAPAYPHCADIASKARLHSILAGLEAMRAWSSTRYLSTISARTLVMWGDRDRTYPWSQIETLWRQIPNSSLAVLPNCAHAVHAERSELFNMLLDEFCARPLNGVAP